MAEDEMVRQHHQLSGQEAEQTLGDNEGQVGLLCCSPWGCRVRVTGNLVTAQEMSNNFPKVLTLVGQIQTTLDYSVLSLTSLLLSKT